MSIKTNLIIIGILVLVSGSLFGYQKYQKTKFEKQIIELSHDLQTEREIKEMYKNATESLLIQLEKEREADKLIEEAKEEQLELDLRIDHILSPMQDVESSEILKETMRELRR